MRLTRILTLCSLLLLPLFAGAQEKNYESGELLIRVHPKSNLRELVADLASFQGRPTEARIIESVSPYMNIWLLGFREGIDELAFLEVVQRHPAVHTAQVNHKVTMRSTIPDDPQFGQQWQYVNTGQSGGTPGADIDMDLAWDITTGGVTPSGDTIVVAILDDGISLTHPDFEDNLWVNHGEIPGNGIDDDGNGYVDDYLGWSIVTNSDNISGGGHGTPVAGIVGAKGNNGIGVAGVNWNVKLMIIKNNFNTNEAAVLAAYTYPLIMRMRYNETNGAEGAFVVATNASWGVNFGQPSNAPLWCAFYDTLGVHGIISCGATINSNVNVDVQGDLPTACPSDYLISVTNMNHNDVKVTQAGYGATTIDLGAFGANAHTTANPNGYGGFGGTSGATPHVAGAVALLYSAPCSSLSSLAKADPGAAALLVKQYILDGTDPNASLQGITVTGGRLNVFNSLMLLLENCGPCPAPTQLTASSISDASAQLSWNSTDSTLNSTLQWRVVGDDEWTTVDNAESPYLLEGLLSCTEYEFQIEDICAADSSGYSPSLVFKTDGCCEAPAQFSAMSDGNTVTLNWSAVLVASSYNVEVDCDGQIELYENITNTAFVLTDFEDCSECRFRIQTVCATGEITPFSNPITVAISGCGACLDLSYCPVSGGDTQYEHIASFSFHDLVNNSGDDSGYGDYTGNTITVDPGATYSISVTPGFAGTAYSQRIRVWIDYNQDGVFDDPAELVFSPANGSAAVNGSVTIPINAAQGLTRLRVGTRFANANANTPCPPSGFEGEYEDYCVFITGNLPACEAPDGLSATVNSYTNATLSWSAEPAATEGYALEYRETSSPDWLSIGPLASASFQYNDFLPCTEYEFRVASLCANDEISEFSTPLSFTLNCFPDCTNAPTGLDTTDVTETSAILRWLATPNAEEYEVRVRESGSNWETFVTEQLQLGLLEVLSACKTYEFEVRAICEGDDNVSAFSELFSFETQCLQSAGTIPGTGLQYQVFPNPFSSHITLRTETRTAGELALRLYNALGQVVWHSEERIPAGTHTLELPQTERLPAGTYFLELRQGTEVGRTQLMKH
jgi:serine protease